MQEKVIVAVDAMGGDNAPAEIVKGVVDAVSQSENIIVKLVIAKWNKIKFTTLNLAIK